MTINDQTRYTNRRRDFMKAVGAGLTSSVFDGKLAGANDRIQLAVIGVGLMGAANMSLAMKQPDVQVVAICDVYDPHMELAAAAAAKAGHQPRKVQDFREILADKTVDAVCIATPDHWHAYMTVEACKADKDVYVEKPVSLVVDEGRKMVEAARKYNRVVQAGTMQRSGLHFQKAVQMVRSGQLGKVTFCRAWTHMHLPEEGIGNPPDSPPPSGLNWDLWLGPAPSRPFNRNRFGADRTLFPYSQFRYYWDYAGGMMSDWGVHLLDIIQMAFNEQMPRTITALGGKYWLKDSRETPDTLQVTYEYPGFAAVYEARFANREVLMNREQPGLFDYGITFHGTDGTLYLDRDLFRVIPRKGSGLQPLEEKASNNANMAHWTNFVECIRSRQKPISDIEMCHRSTCTSHLGNVALRSRTRVDWDEQRETIPESDARRFLVHNYRAPWKLVV